MWRHSTFEFSDTTGVIKDCNGMSCRRLPGQKSMAPRLGVPERDSDRFVEVDVAPSPSRAHHSRPDVREPSFAGQYDVENFTGVVSENRVEDSTS